MRRFVTLALILVFSVPVGLSISGCSKGSNLISYCTGSTGEQEGQVTNVSLEPRLFGLSITYGSTGQLLSPVATDCKGSSVPIGRYTYGTTNITFADVSPSGGVCAGTWNRNSAGGVADYTTCSPPVTTLPVPSTPAFSTPTAPTATAGATSTLNYATNPNGVNGTIDISLGGGPALTGTISGTTSASGFTAAFNGISAFSSAGIVATSTNVNNIVTITGPIGVTRTLSFAGTALTGYVPVAFVTASAAGATSNAVPVYVHPAITSMQLTPQTACFSQGTATTLTASVTGIVNGVATDISALTGPLNFEPQDSSVVSINSTVIPPIATAQLPGSTIISATTSNASGPAGVYFTCPPKSITLNVANSSATSINLNLNTPQALNATVLDTNNHTITGLNLEYVSTSPNTVSASSSGSVTATFPGSGTITAICQPGGCNPSPLNQIGEQGNGLPVTSNPIHVTTPGTVNTVLFMASTGSQYFTNIDFSTGIVGSPVRLPFMPNSMISDKLGQTMYFGSATELMEVSMTTNAVTKEDASVRGTVIGVSNDGSNLVMSDAVHNIIYIYSPTTGANKQILGATATRAEFSPDDQTVYITGSNSSNGSNFFVYSSNFDQVHTYTLSPAPVDVAVTVPSIGAYIAEPAATAAGSFTTAVSYCPTGGPPPTLSPDTYYPQADSQAAATTRLAATFDGKHILGAYVPPAAPPVNSPIAFNDLVLTLPSSAGPNNPGACPPAAGFTFNTVSHPQTTSVNASSITGVLPDAGSQIAFVTYTTTATTGPAILPAYLVASSGAGTIANVTLSGSATAPVSGIFSPDRQTFYTGTSGDNLVHIINVLNVLNSATPTDTGTKNPGLPSCAAQDVSGNCTTLGTGFATPNLLADKPRPTT